MKLQVVILAAGQGKRMRSQLPKVLHCVAGKPLLQHVIDTAALLQPAKLSVVYGHEGERIQAGVKGEQLSWVWQEKQLGTGHALQQALTTHDMESSTHVLVLYGDVPFASLATLQKMQAQAQLGAAIVVLTAIVANPLGLGRIIRNANGALQRIVEERDATLPERAITEINSGLMLCSIAALQRLLPLLGAQNAQGEYYLTDIIALASEREIPLATVTVLDPMEVQGVNDREQLSTLERYHQGRLAKNLMANGVTLADPARMDIRGDLTTGMDVFIDINCVFEGVVQLGHNVSIGPNCLIKNSIIEKDAVIHANTMIDGAFIAAAATVGPFARIRPGSHISEEAQVGNFVELKKTLLGKRSKANHLAYLGDATIGAGVNIGAGVITCNYDGVNKHPTTIEDDVFIGADSQLIAPVHIGRGATIGAGSTITEDAPANTLTLARAKQISISAWCRPIKKL